jgi:hypothetical protein
MAKSMVEILKEGFWSTYEKMDELDRKIWLQELREHLLADDREGKSRESE